LDVKAGFQKKRYKWSTIQAYYAMLSLLPLKSSSTKPMQYKIERALQLFGIFTVDFNRGPRSKDGIIANNTIIPRMRQAWFMALRNSGTSLVLLS
jgi:hypothetical protein